MAGYSGTQLLKKLSIKDGYQCFVLNEPEPYWEWLSPLLEGVKTKTKASKESLDFIHLFVKEEKVFGKEFIKQRSLLKKEGMMWISWPKKSSKVVTDLDENKIRDFRFNVVDLRKWVTLFSVRLKPFSLCFLLPRA